ncbi:MAG: AAA family ATPase, partial [Candidatus Acidiferrum sp.]
MFLDFYQLKEQPFGVTPDPHFLYLSGSHREALASLFYGVETGRGLMALVAPPGMGKTTLLFRLLEHLRRSARTAFLFQTQCDSFGLMRYLMGDLGIDTRGQDFVTMHEQLNELLVREANNGKRFVLVIDEAQNLDDSVL